MKKYLLLIACVLASVASLGCKDKSRPADLPEDMSPCFVTITQEGKPLEGASVSFEYTTPVKYTTSGVTDANGVAQMSTYGYGGAQIGTAKVVVTKMVTEGLVEATDDEEGSMGSDFYVVDAKYGSVTPRISKSPSVAKNVRKRSKLVLPFMIPQESVELHRRDLYL